MRKILRFLFAGKRAIFTGPLFLALLVSPYFIGRYAWYHGGSRGTYTGVIRKVSVKGPPMCKYVSAELLINGTNAQQIGIGEMREFTLDDTRSDNPLLKQLEQAEREGRRVTVHYRQDIGNKDKFWLFCERPEYYAEKVE